MERNDLVCANRTYHPRFTQTKIFNSPLHCVTSSLWSGSRFIVYIKFDGDTHISGTIGKTPLVIGKQEILLFFIREIKHKLHGKASQMKKSDIEGM